MRYALVLLTALLVVGCESDVGRYQIVVLKDESLMYRIDTKTGDIARCLHLGSAKRATCSGGPN